MSSSLDDVLNSAQSPLEVKDPMALKFLPSTLLEELRVVKTGETLSLHPLFQMIMDAASACNMFPPELHRLQL